MENPFELIEKRLVVIEEKLDELIKRPDNPVVTGPTWISSKQLALHLGVSSAFVANLRISKLPYYKLGGRIFFKKQEIDEWIEKTRHKTGEEHLLELLGSNK